MGEAFYLKHKDCNVAMLSMDEDGNILDHRIINVDRMPYLGQTEPWFLYDWWRDRTIPEGTDRLSSLLRQHGCTTPKQFLMKNLGLSLTDAYWICPADYDLHWKDVNLFSNGGRIQYFRDREGRVRYSTSPDAAITGSLDKEAAMRDGAWYMVKQHARNHPDGQQNVNEEFVTELHRLQGFPEFVPYTADADSTGVCRTCTCRYFTSEDRELLSAFEVSGGDRRSKYSGREELERFVGICSAHGLDAGYVHHFLDYMILMDFVTSNTDRHWNNFGVLRDPGSLSFISMAPIFDNGNCMSYDETRPPRRPAILKRESTGIEKKDEKRLLLVHDRNAVDPGRLPSPESVEEYYDSHGISGERARMISLTYSDKLDLLLEFQHGFTVSFGKDMYGYIDKTPYRKQKPDPAYFRENPGELTEAIGKEISAGKLMAGMAELPVKESAIRRKAGAFTLVCGLPCTGKTAYAEAIIKKGDYREIVPFTDLGKAGPGTCVFISMSEVREWISPDGSTKDDKAVKNAVRSMVARALEAGSDVVYKATNLSRDTRDEFLKIARKAEAEEARLAYLKTDIDLLRRQNDILQIPPREWNAMAKLISGAPPENDRGWDRLDVVEADISREGLRDHRPVGAVQGRESSGKETGDKGRAS